MTEFTPVTASIGGILIGLAAAILFVANGNIAGISGIVSRALAPLKSTNLWQILFVAGLIVGCWVSFTFFDVAAPQVPDKSLVILSVAGLLVGLGSVLGSGCTSGHGVCGIGRFSKRSIVATLVFMLFGFVTATLVGLYL